MIHNACSEGQIRLQRRLFVATAIVSSSVFFGVWTHASLEQRAAVAGIEALGGNVYHDREAWPLPANWTDRLAATLGDDAVFPVVTACPDEASLDRAVPWLRRLRRLEMVWFYCLEDRTRVEPLLVRELPGVRLVSKMMRTY